MQPSKDIEQRADRSSVMTNAAPPMLGDRRAAELSHRISELEEVV
ncbi:hypothetical protein FHU30_008129 [Actinomadura rupiterrae]|nr:hypothetical protein [Actinomadura rupiterrae]